MARPRLPQSCAPALLVASSLLATGCGGGSDNAVRNRTFYDYSTSRASSQEVFERRFPRLDLAENPPIPEYLGVAVLHDGAVFSRPRNWTIREASNEPGRTYIQYVSPHAYSFALYERNDPARDSWRDVLGRYEDDVASVGAKMIGGRIPVATWHGQGRAYSIERQVEATKKPLISHSREIVLRGDHHIVLVQIVHEGADVSGIEEELVRTIDSLEVL